MISKELSTKFDTFIGIAKEKKFRQEDTKMLGLLALTKNAEEVFGTSEKSFDYLISLAKKHDSQETIDKFSEKIGI